MSIHCVPVWCPWRSEEGIGSSETRVADGELPRGCWQSNPRSLKEKSSLSCSYLLILTFWHLQLTLKSSFWGERQRGGGRAADGDPCSGGLRERCAPVLLTSGWGCDSCRPFKDTVFFLCTREQDFISCDPGIALAWELVLVCTVLADLRYRGRHGITLRTVNLQKDRRI